MGIHFCFCNIQYLRTVCKKYFFILFVLFMYLIYAVLRDRRLIHSSNATGTTLRRRCGRILDVATRRRRAHNTLRTTGRGCRYTRNTVRATRCGCWRSRRRHNSRGRSRDSHAALRTTRRGCWRRGCHRRSCRRHNAMRTTGRRDTLCTSGHRNRLNSGAGSNTGG
jgi:hypothetical protein